MPNNVSKLSDQQKRGVKNWLSWCVLKVGTYTWFASNKKRVQFVQKKDKHIEGRVDGTQSSAEREIKLKFGM
jgi:hypothetical protein